MLAKSDHKNKNIDLKDLGKKIRELSGVKSSKYCKNIHLAHHSFLCLWICKSYSMQEIMSKNKNSACERKLFIPFSLWNLHFPVLNIKAAIDQSVDRKLISNYCDQSFQSFFKQNVKHLLTLAS